MASRAADVEIAIVAEQRFKNEATAAAHPDTTRANETIGYLVIEATQSGNIEGLPFVAGVGGDTVRGVGNGTYQYSYTAMPNAKTAILSSAGMDGGDGGWPVLYGNNPLPASGGTIDLAIDEDQLSDSERNHTTEQVAYFVIDPPLQQAAETQAMNNVAPLATMPHKLLQAASGDSMRFRSQRHWVTMSRQRDFELLRDQEQPRPVPAVRIAAPAPALGRAATRPKALDESFSSFEAELIDEDVLDQLL